MFDTKDKIHILKEKIDEIGKTNLSFMEVCGTHTMSVAKHAIKSMLPETINIVSGPGCPVCVTSAADIETALNLARQEDKIICTFGDMIKVPSKKDALQNYKNVEIVYSPLDALTYAGKYPDKEVVMLGIGFETTTPLISATIKTAKDEEIDNFSVISMHKTVPEALKAILAGKDISLNGLILPGHVSAITGRTYFDFIKEYETNGVIAGFEALDLLECIYLLSKNIEEGRVEVVNNYQSVVSEKGNKVAMNILYEVFENCDADWRGIGTIPMSGLKIRDEFEKFDAKKRFDIEAEKIDEPEACKCGEILMARARPNNCTLFGKACTPADPVGPCMVSSEGTCAAYYTYM